MAPNHRIRQCSELCYTGAPNTGSFAQTALRARGIGLGGPAARQQLFEPPSKFDQNLIQGTHCMESAPLTQPA
eukprot:scaffold283903_cov18-Tisochrysis_lutea.AAC.3